MQNNAILITSAKKSVFFQDFLRFLRLLQKRPLELTKTGNLKIKEIHAVHEICKYDFFPRDKDGSLMFPVRTEDDFRYLRHLRQIATVEKFIYKRKNSIKLNGRGQEFLERPLDSQFLQIVISQIFNCSWVYLFPYGGRREFPLERIGENSKSFISLLHDHADGKWYELSTMTEDIAEQMQFTQKDQRGYFPDENLLTEALDWIFTYTFRYFDLFKLKTKKIKRSEDFTFIKLAAVKLTKTGKLILDMILDVSEENEQLISAKPLDKISAKQVDKKLHKLLEQLGLSSKVTVDDIKNVIYHSPRGGGSKDVFGVLMTYADTRKKVELILEVINLAWNNSPHKVLDNLSPRQKVEECQTGKTLTIPAPDYKSDKTQAYQLAEEALPSEITIESWGSIHRGKKWGVSLSKSFYQAEHDLSEIRENNTIRQATTKIKKLLKKEPLYFPAISDLISIYRDTNQDKKVTLLMEYSYKMLQKLFPADFDPDNDIFPWVIESNRSFLSFLLEHASMKRDIEGVNKSTPYFEYILKLNPNDNQGVRDILASNYLKTNQPDKVIELSKQFHGDLSSGLAMGKVIAWYKLGEISQAKKYYQKYKKYLQHLAEELLATDHPEPSFDDSPFGGVLMGSREEAYLYWIEQGVVWQGTKGALEWLRSIL